MFVEHQIGIEAFCQDGSIYFDPVQLDQPTTFHHWAFDIRDQPGL
jgi:hypothetical protein